jgi:DNA-binding beta-propeller fold protein YncE
MNILDKIDAEQLKKDIATFNVGDTINPEGSISIISLAGGVAAATVSTASFSAFNGQEARLRGQGVRISTGKSFAVDAEPESIAVSADGSTARITLQENNGVAKVNLKTNTIEKIFALGTVDYKNLLVDQRGGGNRVNKKEPLKT